LFRPDQHSRSRVSCVQNEITQITPKCTKLHQEIVALRQEQQSLRSQLNGSHGEYTGTDDLAAPVRSRNEYSLRAHYFSLAADDLDLVYYHAATELAARVWKETQSLVTSMRRDLDALTQKWNNYEFEAITSASGPRFNLYDEMHELRLHIATQEGIMYEAADRYYAAATLELQVRQEIVESYMSRL